MGFRQLISFDHFQESELTNGAYDSAPFVPLCKAVGFPVAFHGYRMSIENRDGRNWVKFGNLWRSTGNRKCTAVLADLTPEDGSWTGKAFFGFRMGLHSGSNLPVNVGLYHENNYPAYHSVTNPNPVPVTGLWDDLVYVEVIVDFDANTFQYYFNGRLGAEGELGANIVDNRKAYVSVGTFYNHSQRSNQGCYPMINDVYHYYAPVGDNFERLGGIRVHPLVVDTVTASAEWSSSDGVTELSELMRIYDYQTPEDSSAITEITGDTARFSLKPFDETVVLNDPIAMAIDVADNDTNNLGLHDIQYSVMDGETQLTNNTYSIVNESIAHSIYIDGGVGWSSPEVANISVDVTMLDK